MIIRLLLMISIYSLIMSPLTYMSGVDNSRMNNVYNTVQKLNPDAEEKYKGTNKDFYNEVISELGWSDSNTNNMELKLVNNINGDAKSFKAVLVDKTYETEKLDKLAEKVYNDKEKDIEKIKAE